MQESLLYRRVKGSLLFQNPYSANSTKFSFSRYATKCISATHFFEILKLSFEKGSKLKKIAFHFTTTRQNTIMAIKMVRFIG